MKRLSILLVSLGAVALLHAQPKSYISVWGEAGESSFLTSIENAASSTSFGVGGGVGAGYEMHVSKFMWTAGLHFNTLHNSFRLGNIENSFDAVDDEGDAFLFTYRQNNRRDSYTEMSLQIPVMLGADLGRFYFLAGVKMDFSLFGRSRVKTVLTSSGEYVDLIDPLSGMPEHGFFNDMAFNQKAKFSFRTDVMLSAELGFNLGMVTKETGYDVPKSKRKYRIALFADYGFLDRHNPSDLESITLPTSFDAGSMADGITVNNILSTNQVHGKVNNLLVGIKFTVLFKLPEASKCVICEYDPPVRW